MKMLALVFTVLLLSACEKADFSDTEGAGYRYADFDGKWRIVNYWATWCGPCIKEIPELNELAHEYNDSLVVLGVNFDSPQGEEAQISVKKMKIEFPVYAVNPAGELGITTPEVLPTTFVFSPDGALHRTLIGPQTRESLLAALE